MVLDPEEWMDLRRFRALYEAGVSISAIARETGHDWRTVKKYLSYSGRCRRWRRRGGERSLGWWNRLLR